MINDRRRLWTTLLFIGLFAPVLIILILILIMPSSLRIGGSSKTATTAPAGPTTQTGAPLPTTPDADAALSPPPLFIAGDGRDLWVVPPPTLAPPSATPFASFTTPPESGFDLFYRASNSSTWSRSTQRWPGIPQAFALMLPQSNDARRRSTPYVITRSGAVSLFTLENSETIATLPPGQTVKALAGAADSLFLASWGPQPVPATRPTESPTSQPHVATTAASLPALSPTTNAVSTMAPSSAPAPPSGPAAETQAAASPPAPSTLNLFWFPPHGTTLPGLKPAQWALLPALPIDPSTPGPDATAIMAMTVQTDRLILCWITPAHPEALLIRTLNYQDRTPAWSPAALTTLAPKDRGAARLFAITLDKSNYLLWTLAYQNTISIHGGRLTPLSPPETTSTASTAPATASASPAFTLLPKNQFLTPLTLAPSDALSATTDVAIGPAENTFIAVCINKDRVLTSFAFNDQGRLLSPPTPIEARPLQHDMEVGQNIAILMLMLMFSLSLWQWQQKPVTPALPADTIIAPLHLRGIAFAIDAAIPYLLVLMLFGLWDNGPLSPVLSWVSMLAQPQELLHSLPFLTFISIYFLHVALGELFFRRSIGKAIVGIQVLMLDGKAPTLAAIVIRNLVRIPETVLGLVIIYILISERQQRLGDLLARTLVVAPQPPEMPPDPDKEPPTKD